MHFANCRPTLIFNFQLSIFHTLGQFNSLTCKTNFSNGERRFAVLSVFQINIFLVFGNTHICRTDNLTTVDKLLKSVCAPTRNTSCCKKRSIKLTRNIKKATRFFLLHREEFSQKIYQRTKGRLLLTTANTSCLLPVILQ